jgi:hypothetical protein
MTDRSVELANPPQEPRALELWLQHVAGFVLFRDVREYARKQLDPALSGEARNAAFKAIDDALYGLMMVADGVTGALTSGQLSAAVRVSVVLRRGTEVLSRLDLGDGDGACMGFHGWLAGDFGSTPVTPEGG